MISTDFADSKFSDFRIEVIFQLRFSNFDSSESSPIEIGKKLKLLEIGLSVYQALILLFKINWTKRPQLKRKEKLEMEELIIHGVALLVLQCGDNDYTHD